MNAPDAIPRLRRAETVLLVIDEQERLMPSIHDEARVRANTVRLVRAAQVLGLPIVATEQYPQGLGRTVSDVAAAWGELPILEKMAFSTFGDPAFVTALDDLRRRTLLVAGVEAHVCVTQSVLDGLRTGYRVHVVADAVSSRASENRALGLARMRRSGAVITSTEMALFELLDRAGTPEFKEILKLVK